MIDEASAAMANQHADSLRMMEKEVDAYRQAKVKRIWTVIIVIALDSRCLYGVFLVDPVLVE